MSDQRVKYFRTVALGGLAVLIFVLGWKSWNPGGQIEAVQDFSGFTPYISDFYPDVRVRELSNHFYPRKGIRTLITDPVYFDLKTTWRYKKAEVTVVFQNPDYPVFNLGIKKWEDVWGFDFKPLTGAENIIRVMVDGEEWSKATYKFDLTQYALISGKYVFILSAPGLDQSDKVIKIKEIRVTTEK